MSHEIRTPLNGVVGMIDLLRATGLTEAQTRYAHLARESADSLMAVINDILDFSKIEAGKVEIESIEFDLCKLAEDLTELLAPMAAKKRLALACFLAPDVPHRMIGDPNRVRQILTNLVNNALKFTSRGHVAIRIKLDSQQADTITLRAEVEDTGIGIPADRLDRLFKSFSQVDTSTTRKYGGTGLGLAISKHLVELMGGNIGITSEEGKGTTFWFTLKVGKASNSELVATGPAETLRNLRVLCVEPDPTYRRILSEQLKGRLSPDSHIVDTQDALAALRRAVAQGKPYSIALVPHGTGKTPLTTAIRSDDSLRQIKLVAVMDIDDRTDAAAVRGNGFAGRLHRPIIQSRLLDVLVSAAIHRHDDAPSARPATIQENPLKGLHLLVAEDNEMNQFVTQETLRRVGCTCDIAGDGLLAIEALSKKRYDAILMDCQMPNMGGLEASEKIREIEKANGARRIPIIALTAEAIAGDREKCLAAGMDGYVTKPINAADLFTAIGSLVGPHAQASPTPGQPETAPAVPAPTIPIDVEALVMRCMNDTQFAAQTLTKFHVRSLEDVKLLRKGIAASDADGARRIAHNLKSVAAHVAAVPLAKIAFEIEQAGIRRDLAYMQDQIEQLDREAKRCAEFIPGAMEKIARM
jgi:CheY-like chemotaxis protein/HPt (histidine-containing phosphotransfer) domain-containing protein